MAARLACMILAAGFGTRMRELTQTRPKPLIAVGGRALIDHALDIATQAGCAPIVVNAHYHADQIKAHLAGRNVIVLTETPDILDSGGGIANALPHLGDRFFTLNSDAIFTGANPLVRLAQAWNDATMSGLMLTQERARATARQGGGDLDIDPSGHVTFAKTPQGDVYTGAQMLRAAAFAQAPKGAFSLRVIWDDLAAQKRLFAIRHGGGWADVGYPEAIAQAEALLG